MNFFIIFKNTLSIWLIPALFASQLIKSFNLFTNYASYILLCYLIVFALFYFTERKIFFYIDRIFMLYFSLLIFVNNNIFSTNYLIFSFFVVLFILLFYIFLFYFLKKRKKFLTLNFTKLSFIIELIFIVSIFLFGTYSEITTVFLVTALIDIVYKILVLTIIGHLKKSPNN